ncbi:cation efflux protein [Phascolomyces articulosus]|uniref:Cation efflux protein n=1 Tax=Phascolomyces articulosus TaxID=60185 RepID=A0AAD5PEI4_9FUNG|nr:cation efflux protein [Phascolomyces articulosus]
MLSRQVRIWIMFGFTGAFFISEIVVGYYVSSLALVADSFHMLNDMLSFGVALWAIKAAVRDNTDNPKYSYGWQRAEILGALINAVFLLALCVMIVIEAIQRFFNPEPVTNPVLVLIMGCCGLAGNLVGMFLFHEHGHGHGHNHHHDEEKQGHSHHHHGHGGGGHLNMKGIFLHVLGDALGNIGVITSALIIWLTDWSWRFYFDPIISLVISAIIFTSAIPLVRATASILLQAAPTNIAIDSVKRDLLQVEGILAVHELHIWQLSDTKHIASVHVLLKDPTTYMTVAKHIRKLLHSYDVHSVTIQPEFTSLAQFAGVESGTFVEKGAPETDKEGTALCLIRCTDNACVENACCPLQKSDNESSFSSTSS